MAIPKSVGKRIKKFRKERGLTQEQLAEMINLSSRYIGYIEQGDREPSLKVLQKIAKALNVTVKDLFP